MDILKQVLSKLEKELEKYPAFEKCVVCGCDLIQPPNGVERMLCQHKDCLNTWKLIPYDYRDWFHDYKSFRSERKRTFAWLKQFGYKISIDLIKKEDRHFYHFYENGTIRCGNDYVKKPNKELIYQKFNQYKLKRDLTSVINRTERKSIGFCKPIKYKIVKLKPIAL